MSMAAGYHSPSTKKSTPSPRTCRIGVLVSTVSVTPCPSVTCACAAHGQGDRAGARPPGAFCDDGAVPQTVEFRPRLGRGLTVGVAVLAVCGVVLTTVDDLTTALRYAPMFALAVVVVWALFGRPAVLVSDSGIELRNVLRTIELPWPAIERIDTKYALTLYTAYGVYAAWAAPAPSRVQALGATRDDTRHLPESSYIGGVAGRSCTTPGTWTLPDWSAMLRGCAVTCWRRQAQCE